MIRLGLILLIQLCLLGAHGSAGAESLPPSLRHVPWYDADRQELRPVHVSPSREPRAPSDWEKSLLADDNSSTEMPHDGTSTAGALSLTQIAGYAAIVLALGTIVVALAWYAGNRFSAGRQPPLEPSSIAPVIFEVLPQQIPVPKSDLLTEAKRCYELGDFGLAMAYFYSYQLVELDRHGWLRLARGKTTRQYLREIARHAQAHALLRSSARMFEAFFFGQHAPDRQQFDLCWQQRDAFQAWIRRTPGE